MWTPSKLPIVTTDPGPPASPAGNSWSSSIAMSAGQHLGRPEQSAVELTDADQLTGWIVHPALPGDVGQDRPGQPHRLAAPDLQDLGRSEIDQRQVGHRPLRREERSPGVVHGRELVEGDRRAEHEGPIARPRQPAQQPTGPEGVAEVGGDDSHVGALTADDHDLRLRDRTRPEIDELRRVDGHAARLADDLLTGARELVQMPALMPDRRVHRGNLQDLAREANQLGADLVGGDATRVSTGDHRTLGVAGITALAETDHAVID